MSVRAEYTSTLDEIADLHFRAHSRLRLYRRSRLQSTFWAGAASVVVVVLMLTVAGTRPLERFVFAGLGGVISSLLNWFFYPRNVRGRIRKLLRERLPSDERIHFVVELRDDCVWTRLGGTQLSFDWDNVARIDDFGDVVEFRMRDGGWMYVREKGFRSPQDRREFVEMANRKMHASQSGGPDDTPQSG